MTQTQFLINGKPFYLNGVDRHEDWDVSELCVCVGLFCSRAASWFTLNVAVHVGDW